jgi:stage II sporulation protein AA (anti-sigma F factor antagonist)
MAEQLTRGDPLSGPPTLDVGVRVTGFRAVSVVAAGEIDTLGAPVVEAALSRVWNQGSRRVTVDLTAVTFLNGAGLHVLARARSTARRRRAALTLRAGDHRVYRLLELVGLRDVTVGPPAPVEPDSVGRPRTPRAILRPDGPQPLVRGTADALSGASVASRNVRGVTQAQADAPRVVRGVIVDERVTWVECPNCGQRAAIGWADRRPIEFDCTRGCRLPAPEVALMVRPWSDWPPMNGHA